MIFSLLAGHLNREFLVAKWGFFVRGESNIMWAAPSPILMKKLKPGELSSAEVQ